MRFKILLIIIISFISASVSAEEWKTKDKILLSSYIALSSIDAYQTSKWNDKEMQEVNPMFTNKEGKVNMTSVIGYKVIAGIGLYLLADYAKKYRTHILSIAVGIQGGVVAWNSQF